MRTAHCLQWQLPPNNRDGPRETRSRGRRLKEVFQSQSQSRTWPAADWNIKQTLFTHIISTGYFVFTSAKEFVFPPLSVCLQSTNYSELHGGTRHRLGKWPLQPIWIIYFELESDVWCTSVRPRWRFAVRERLSRCLILVKWEVLNTF